MNRTMLTHTDRAVLKSTLKVIEKKVDDVIRSVAMASHGIGGLGRGYSQDFDRQELDELQAVLDRYHQELRRARSRVFRELDQAAE